jgi:single-strand DNA-binding protein
MAGCVNKVIILGNLGADPEVRQVADGRSICNLRIATTDSWKDKQSGERKDRTEWHSATIYNESLAKIAQQYLKKGSKVYIEGSLETRKWQDNSGNDRYTTEIVLRQYRGELTLLDPRQSDSAAPQRENMRSAPQRAQNSPQPGRNNIAARQLQATSWADEPLDDEIPF